jgi:hypothetical protein
MNHSLRLHAGSGRSHFGRRSSDRRAKPISISSPPSTTAPAMHTFDDLLQLARQQPQPQRLLLVFACAELPRDASVEEMAAFERGEGGALTPAACVDKLPEEIASFAALRHESQQATPHWDVLFVAALDGRGGHAPNSDEAVQPLRMMLEQIKGGQIGRFLAVGSDGSLLQLQRG